jgi:hypothetical protein
LLIIDYFRFGTAGATRREIIEMETLKKNLVDIRSTLFLPA